MAHKSIADTILMELKKEREETLEKNKNICLEFMQNVFINYLLKPSEKLETDKSFVYSGSIDSLPINKNDFMYACNLLGFKVSSGLTTISFTVPSREKGKNMTPAQKMLYDYTVSYNKKMKERNQLAQAEINKVWDSIKNRDFTSKDENNGTFTITLSLNENRDKEFCDEKLRKFLSARAFTNVIIVHDTLLITLGSLK